MPENRPAPRNIRGTDTIDYRLGVLETDIRNIAQSVTNLTNSISASMKRVEELETWKQDQRVERADREARQEERDKALAKSLESIMASIASIRSEMQASKSSWGNRAWAIFQPIMITVIVFILAGAFRNVPLP